MPMHSHLVNSAPSRRHLVTSLPCHLITSAPSPRYLGTLTSLPRHPHLVTSAPSPRYLGTLTSSPRHLVTLSPRYLGTLTSPPRHLVISLPRHLATSSPRYITTSPQGNEVTRWRRFRRHLLKHSQIFFPINYYLKIYAHPCFSFEKTTPFLNLRVLWTDN
jgi:hypothetical protein